MLQQRGVCRAVAAGNIVKAAISNNKQKPTTMSTYSWWGLRSLKHRCGYGRGRSRKYVAENESDEDNKMWGMAEMEEGPCCFVVQLFREM